MSSSKDIKPAMPEVTVCTETFTGHRGIYVPFMFSHHLVQLERQDACRCWSTSKLRVTNDR